MKNFTKTVRIGRVDLGYCGQANLYCKIRYSSEGELSITGVEGPLRNGNAKGSCGQIIMHSWDIVEYAEGWNGATVRKFRDIWDRWHLNQMNAGSPEQMKHLRKLKAEGVEFKYGEGFDSHYTWACDQLDKVNLNPDGGKYGSKWWSEEAPQDVLEWLQALPDTDRKPAWV